MSMACAQGLASVAAGGLQRRLLHGGAVDADIWAFWGRSGASFSCGQRSATRRFLSAGSRGTDSSTLPLQTVCGSRISPMFLTGAGLPCVAFVIDAYARRIVGWRASRTAHADSGPGRPPEQALRRRRPGLPAAAASFIIAIAAFNKALRSGIIERLAEAGIELPSAASAILTPTTPSPKRSTAYTRLRSSIDEARGVTSRGHRVRNPKWVDWFNNIAASGEPIGADPAGRGRGNATPPC